MALCLAESLIEQEEFDPQDQLKRYVKWWKEGYLSSTGHCVDIGNTTQKGLVNFKRTGEKYPGPTGEYTAGNGSLMRLAPVPLFYSKVPEKAIEKAGLSSKTTHGEQRAVDACRYFSGLIVGAVQGYEKEEMVNPYFSPIDNYWDDHSLTSEIDSIAHGSFKEKEPHEIEGDTYVVKTLEAVLWVFHETENFRDGVLKVVNLGDDADTTGAIFGQLGGAYYGVEAIPEKWRNKLAKKELIESMAEDLLELSKKLSL